MASTIYNVEKQQNVRGKSAGEMKVEKGKMADIKRHTKEKIDGMRRTKRLKLRTENVYKNKNSYKNLQKVAHHRTTIQVPE